MGGFRFTGERTTEMMFSVCKRGATVHATLLFVSCIVLIGCAPNYVIDRRAMDEQLRSRPVPIFSAIDIAAFAKGCATHVPRGCAPVAPPIREMRAQKVNVVTGRVRTRLRRDGYFDLVRVMEVDPPAMVDVLRVTSELAFTTPPCQTPPMDQSVEIEIPFTFRLGP